MAVDRRRRGVAEMSAKTRATKDGASQLLARAKLIVEALAGHSFEGLRNTQVATAINDIEANSLRTLQRLESIGWTERVPGKQECWRLSPRLVQIAIAHQNELARLTQRVDDFTNRYSRTPN